MHPETMVSCLLAPDFFPDSLPASRGALAPSRLFSRRQPQSPPWDPTSDAQASSPSPHLPRWVSRQASRAGECWSAPILCRNLSALPSAPLLLRSPLWLLGFPHPHPPSPPVKGLPSEWKLSLLHSSLPLVQVPSLFFCLCFLFFLLLSPRKWGVSCLFGSVRSFASVQ